MFFLLTCVRACRLRSRQVLAPFSPVLLVRLSKAVVGIPAGVPDDALLSPREYQCARIREIHEAPHLFMNTTNSRPWLACANLT